MRRRVTIGIMSVIAFVTAAAVAVAFGGSTEERDALSRALPGAWLPLESGLAVSAREGTPLSAKYEIDDGEFQLSVYTLKRNASGDAFAEVIVDYNAGIVTKVIAITDGGDLAAAQAQKAALVTAKRSLADATTSAVKAHAGYRAVSAMPTLDGGRPVAEITLARGDDWKVVTERLD